jgi:hypothetical protein
MFTDGDMGERHGRVLAELAETGMVMVRRLSDAMLATDDVQIQAQLGLAFHRVSRAVRQTLALEFRLSQEARREDRPAPARETPPPEATPKPSRPPAERTGWSEYERDDSHEALEDLDVLLDAEDLDLDAVHEAVETCIARIRHDLAAEPIPAAGAAVLARPAPPGRTRDRLFASVAGWPGPRIGTEPRSSRPWSGFG